MVQMNQRCQSSPPIQTGRDEINNCETISIHNRDAWRYQVDLRGAAAADVIFEFKWIQVDSTLVRWVGTADNCPCSERIAPSIKFDSVIEYSIFRRR